MVAARQNRTGDVPVTKPEASRNEAGKPPVAVVIGATSKWQADGRNTKFIHGGVLDDSDLPISARWGAGGGIAQKFAAEGYVTVITSRTRANARGLADAIGAAGGQCHIVELDVGEAESVARAFGEIRELAGEPDIVIYNAGYMDGRDLPDGMDLLEHVPNAVFETAIAVSARGPFLVAKEVLPAMRRRGSGSLFFTNNPNALRGKKRQNGESLYYPRVLIRTLSQVLADEYSEAGVHVANLIVDGYIDSPGTRHHPAVAGREEVLIKPAAIADAFWYLHNQDPSVWCHEMQLTPHAQRISV